MTKRKEIIPLHINGERHEVVIRKADTLLDTLRNQMGLTSVKPACENGDCGACTVLINQKPIHSCLSLTIENTDKSITTNEGLKNSPLQEAFVKHWAIQCGYCTSGFIMNSHALLQQHPEASDEIIDEWLASNLCRCTGYQEIKEAVKSVIDRNTQVGKAQ